ncbi:hypothetical protein LEN26_014415 [Aphanomyces euteiches]|nr:hypothetical protein LEN26_014415 [Aphanomyces euteiches]
MIGKHIFHPDTSSMAPTLPCHFSFLLVPSAMKLVVLSMLAYALAQAPAPCTEKQIGDVVAAINASTNLAGCTKDSGYNWLTFFTTADGLSTEQQEQASSDSKSCMALVAEANKLTVPSCLVWNNDLATLIKQSLGDWTTAKNRFIVATVKTYPRCTNEQLTAFVALVSESKNLDSCSKAAGFAWLTFFTTQDIPTQAQLAATSASKECAAFVADVNGLKVDACALWIDNLQHLITLKPDNWVDAKVAGLKVAGNSSLPSNATNATTSAPTISSNTTTAAQTTTPKSSASTVAAGVLAAVVALVMP